MPKKKKNNLLQPKGGTVGNQICKRAISQGYIRDLVVLVPMSWEDGIIFQQLSYLTLYALQEQSDQGLCYMQLVSQAI